MWVRHDAARTFWKDTPDPAEDDEPEWAEFRVSAQAKLLYETRAFNQPAWKNAASRAATVRRSVTRSAIFRRRVADAILILRSRHFARCPHRQLQRLA
jgi:hypothetical protein